jgi:hypothetical protein
MAVIIPPTGSGDVTPSVATYTSSAGASGTHYQQVTVRPDVSATVARLSSTSISANTTAADTIIVAGVASQTIRVMGLFIGSTVAQTWKLRSSGNDLFPSIPLPAGTFFQLPILGEPYFLTTAGGALLINQSTSIALSGKLYYTQSS